MAARIVELVEMFKENVRTIRNRETNNGLRDGNNSTAIEHGIIIIENRSVISFIILLLLISFILFLYIGSFILNKSHPHFKTVDVQNMHANFYTYTDIISLEQVRVNLRFSFGETKKVKVYPELGTFTISKMVNDSLTIRLVSKAPYRISEKEQLLAVIFKPLQTRVQEKEVKAFQQELDNGHIWMRIDGDFKMQLRLAKFLPFPKITRHLYFGCDVWFKDSNLNEIIEKRCDPFDEPQV